MKYFITPQERKGTCYYEFYKGAWDGETVWAEDSILIGDNEEFWEFGKFLRSVVKNFDYFAVTEVSADQWKALGELAFEEGGICLRLYEEAEPWVLESLREHGCFSIIGM